MKKTQPLKNYGQPWVKNRKAINKRIAQENREKQILRTKEYVMGRNE